MPHLHQSSSWLPQVATLVACSVCSIASVAAAGSDGTPFAQCGTLHVAEADGVICASLDIHIGGVYQLDDAGGFSDGASVCVNGTLTTCGSSCGTPVQGCVSVTSIVLDSPGTGGIDATTVAIDECGTVLEATSACFVFQADGGQLYTVGVPASGGYYEGDRIELSGDLVTCTSSCEPTDGCIVNPQFSTCPLPGDLSGDGHVNGLDLALLLGAWGPCTGCAADLNGSGTVNGLDLAILLGHWS